MKTTIKITQSQNGKETTLWEGSYTEAKNEDAERLTEEVYVVEENDDSYPLLLADGEGCTLRSLSGEECDRLRKDGVVTDILCTHSRADKYGAPVCAANIPEIWKATCGNAGFQPSKNLELSCKDSKDDSVGNFQYSIAVSPELKKTLEEKTDTLVKKLQEELELPEEEAAKRLGSVTDWFCMENTTDLEDTLQEKTQELRSCGGRGIDLAEGIDNLRGYIAAYKETP